MNEINTQNVIEPMERCADCDMWSPDEKSDHAEGECRCNPPVVHIVMTPVQTIQGNAVQAQILSLFPRTKRDMFCGQYTNYSGEGDPDTPVIASH